MAVKRTTVKKGAKKPLKKVKSFNLDDKIYSGLMELLEGSRAQITLSALVDDFLRKLYVYLIEADGLIKKQESDIGLASVLYDCMNYEYFGEAKKEHARVQNLIYSDKAFKEGMSLNEYLSKFVGPYGD